MYRDLVHADFNLITQAFLHASNVALSLFIPC